MVKAKPLPLQQYFLLNFVAFEYGRMTGHATPTTLARIRGRSENAEEELFETTVSQDHSQRKDVASWMGINMNE